MKKILFVAAIAATTLFASCAKDGATTTVSQETTKLTVKISGVATTRAVEAPGVAEQLKLVPGAGDVCGHIYVLNPLGNVLFSVPMIEDDVTSPTGQEITDECPADASVYILGNIPADVNAASLTTLTAIRNAFSAISTQTDYTAVAMANSTGEPVKITVVEKGKAEAKISLSPLVSRMELAQIQAADYVDGSNTYSIVSYKVEGVYIDSYYSQFTMTGAPKGTTYEQYIKTDFTGVTGDIPSTPLNGAGTTAVVPEAGKVWAHQVVSGGLPRFIVHLSDVKYQINDGNVDTAEEDLYITIAGYKDITEFERGKIYKVGNLSFTYYDLFDTPNPDNLTLTVYVTVEDWVLVDAEPIL